MLATIGYERASLPDLIATLKLANTEVLIDVRERAQSRRAGFSKKALSTALIDAGVAYLHLPELGDPKEGRDAARSGDFDEFRSIFAAVMSTEAAKRALVQITEIASLKNICLLCYERDQSQCHRKIVADELEQKLGMRARHLGVKLGASDEGKERRMHHPHQGSTSPVQQVF